MSVDGSISPSGVWIANDFRFNLIIDRYDPVFADMRASKLKHLRSANSEDAVTWNVFRSLRQIEPATWFPGLWGRAFQAIAAPEHDRVSVKLWVSVDPPLGLLAGGDEGASEIDVVLESPDWVWFIEAKHRSDISPGTTTRPDRDQILRNLDVGTYYAGVRDFYFSLLISDEARSPLGVRKVAEYQEIDYVRHKLTHRRDHVRNLKCVGALYWQHLRDALIDACEDSKRDDEKSYARRAVEWLEAKRIVS